MTRVGVSRRMRRTLAVKAATVITGLLAIAACSSSVAPAGTGTPATEMPSVTSSGTALATPTRGSDAAPTPAGSPSEGPIATTTTPPPTTTAGEAPAVTLNGPFGSVDQDPSPPGVDWPHAAGLERLDTYVHSAPLTLTIVDPDLTFATWAVSVIPAASTATSAAALEATPYPPTNPELLSVTGPPGGDWLLRADVTSAGHAPASYFWRLGVPDRDPPADGHVVVPAPDALLATSAASVTGVPGSGCYVDTCSDVGRVPVARDLQQLAGTPRAALTLSLTDDSRFVRWNVSARPVQDTTTRPTTLERGRDPAGADRFTFAPPGRGDWYVTISITFDRRRGSYTWYARLTIP
jgi:hypothetical protein